MKLLHVRKPWRLGDSSDVQVAILVIDLATVWNPIYKSGTAKYMIFEANSY